MNKALLILDDNPNGGSIVQCGCGATFCDLGKAKCPACYQELVYPRWLDDYEDESSIEWEDE